MSSISIVMTAYQRNAQLKNTLDSIAKQTRRPDQIIVVEDGNDGGATQGVCIEARNGGLPVEYYCRKDRPNISYSNPAIPKNIAIKKATGDILIIQCAEVKYESPNDIANLVRPVEENPEITSVATCKGLGSWGGFDKWYAGPERAEAWFLDFCQAIRRDRVLAVGGFDENFKAYGFDDDDFRLRLQESGIKYQWATDVITSHQWHPPANGGGQFSHYLSEMSENDRKYFDRSKLQREAGEKGVVANLGIDWGNILR